MPRFLSNLRNLSLWTGFLSLSPEIFGNCKSKVFLFRGRSTLFAVCRGMRGGKLSLLGDPIQIKWKYRVHTCTCTSFKKLRKIKTCCADVSKYQRPRHDRRVHSSTRPFTPAIPFARISHELWEDTRLCVHLIHALPTGPLRARARSSIKKEHTI